MKKKDIIDFAELKYVGLKTVSCFVNIKITKSKNKLRKIIVPPITLASYL